LELARESGITIPTICHEPHLRTIGACRLCLVENEQNAALVASCVTPIAPGMVINTESPRVMEHRRMIVKLMLASHPDSCLVCDKGNRCQLHQIASDLGIGLLELQRIPQAAVIEEVNPFIERDMSKCILCAKCVRACQELVVEGAIDYFGRGFATSPATLDDSPLESSECTFCGVCVALCPTGSLMEKRRIYRGTTKNLVQTTCPYCGCGCSISLEIKDNRILAARPGKVDAENEGTLCVKGSYGFDFIHSPDRLKKPLLKVNGTFQATSWGTALAKTADALNLIKEKYGPGSLAVLGAVKCTNEENYLLQKFARTVLGTNNIDNSSRLYNPATRLGLGTSIGFPGTTNSLAALEQSEVIIVVGADPASSAPRVNYAVKRAVKLRGAKLVLIDPRGTKLSAFAHLWLRPAVGTDLALLNSMARVIIDEGLMDKEFVTRKTDHFDALLRGLEKYSLAYGETVTGLKKEDIHSAARLYALADQAAIIYGTGITQHPGGSASVKALANLALLTGNIWRNGGGIYALQKDNNGQGACDLGALPDFLPGYQSMADSQVKKKFEERWGVNLPANPGFTALEMIEQIKAGKIKGLYIVGENPVLSFPRPDLVVKALSSLDFLAVQDLFLTETARLAAVVLPAASFAEKEGTFTNFEGKTGLVRKAVVPPGECLPDWEIILRLADKMERSLAFSNLQQVVEEIEALVPLYEGYLDAEGKPQNEWGFGERHSSRWQSLKRFPRFSTADYNPPIKEANGEYPFTLLIESVLYHFGTGTRSSRARRLQQFLPRILISMNKNDAGRLGLIPLDQVRIISPVSELTAAVTITGALPEGIVTLPGSFPETPAVRLFEINLDAETKTPLLKACNVKIERINDYE
jgi:formate dehydrogenase alpha subunit